MNMTIIFLNTKYDECLGSENNRRKQGFAENMNKTPSRSQFPANYL
jgi:hypothetical protein